MVLWATGLCSAPCSAEGQTLTKGWTVQDALARTEIPGWESPQHQHQQGQQPMGHGAGQRDKELTELLQCTQWPQRHP